ncbi:hypothetical protein DPMN_136842 [Dreissena polymorpha]|uniref:Uncharacterized protein n=1 Tax=Dreissena polymorpha TaxID=45954 RepID=A0A9D4G1I2_DREPO|nr:hypothetical protein DPMN_136842 [Dreissena polymorpha]
MVLVADSMTYVQETIDRTGLSDNNVHSPDQSVESTCRQRMFAMFVTNLLIPNPI